MKISVNPPIKIENEKFDKLNAYLRTNDWTLRAIFPEPTDGGEAVRLTLPSKNAQKIYDFGTHQFLHHQFVITASSYLL